MVGLLQDVTFSDRFGRLLAAKNLKPNQFATLAKVAKQTAYNWFNGGAPTQQKHWEAVAEVFGLSVEELRDPNAPLPDWAQNVKPSRPEPERESGGVGPFVEMNYAGVVPASAAWGDPLTHSEETRPVPAFMFSPGNFCAMVSGYSCAPKIMPGDLLIIRPTVDAIDNTLVIAERDDDAGVTVKRASLDAETLQVNLEPLNPQMAKLTVGHSWRTAGLVVGIYNPETEPVTALYWANGLRPNRLPNRLETMTS